MVEKTEKYTISIPPILCLSIDDESPVSPNVEILEKSKDQSTVSPNVEILEKPKDEYLLSPVSPTSPNVDVLEKSKEESLLSPISPVSPNTLEKSIVESNNKPHNFPEGGLKAYMTVLGAFMVFACTFGRMSAFGTYQAWYASHQLEHLSASTISWIGSLQYCVFFFSVRFIFFNCVLSVSLFLILRVRELQLDACTTHMDQHG